jgi:hypothetical protein
MRAALIFAFAFLLASCEAPAAVADVTEAARRYFEVAYRALALMGQNAPDEERRRELADLANNCCTGQLKVKLSRWFSETPISSGSFFDDLQSMRPTGEPQCQPPVLLDDRNAHLTCHFDTSETYSLSRNLVSVADLYSKFDIQNMTLPEASAEISSQRFPELVELVVHIQEEVDLKLQKADGRWLVSDAYVRVGAARIEVRQPE